MDFTYIKNYRNAKIILLDKKESGIKEITNKELMPALQYAIEPTRVETIELQIELPSQSFCSKGETSYIPQDILNTYYTAKTCRFTGGTDYFLKSGMKSYPTITLKVNKYYYDIDSVIKVVDKNIKYYTKHIKNSIKRHQKLIDKYNNKLNQLSRLVG